MASASTALAAEEQRRSMAAFAYRESRARAVRRLGAALCPECRTEVDVAVPAHATNCSLKHGAAEETEVAALHAVPEANPASASTPGYEASAARALARGEADDFDLEICAWCGCEIDVSEPAHRPDCEGIGKARAADISHLAAMRPVERVIEDRPAEADAATITTSSGGAHGADGAETGDSPSDGRVGGATVIRYSVTGRRLSPWTRAECVELVQAWEREHGQPPVLSDWHGVSGFPSAPTYTRLFGGWGAMIEAAGFERPTRSHRRKDSSGFASRTGISGPVSPPDAQQQAGESAATADGSGGAGAATPAPDPEVVREDPRLTIVALPLEQLAAVSAIVASAARALTPFAREARGPLWKIASEIVEQAIAE